MQELNVFRFVPAPITFRDIGGYRCRGTPDLARHSVELRFRKVASENVACSRDIHPQLPYTQLFVRLQTHRRLLRLTEGVGGRVSGVGQVHFITCDADTDPLLPLEL